MSSPWASGQLKMPPQTTTDSLALSFSSFSLLQERLSGYVLYTDALPHVAHLTANRYFFSLPSFPQTSSLPSLCTHTHTQSVTLLSLCSFESRASSLLFSPPPIDRVDYHSAPPLFSLPLRFSFPLYFSDHSNGVCAAALCSLSLPFQIMLNRTLCKR